MARFAVYANPDGPGYLVDLQADINSHFATRVVAPLLPRRRCCFMPHRSTPCSRSRGRSL